MTALFSRRVWMRLFRVGTRRGLMAAVLGVLAIAGAARPTPTSGPLPAASLAAHTTSTLPYFAEIRRTEYGIPHILARDYGGLGYGYGYAFAQDNLCTVADRVVTLRGMRSAYFGGAGDSGDTLGVSTTNLNSDIYYQGLRKSGVVQRLLARPAPLGPTRQARQLVDGYVAGYNRYLRDTGVAHLPDPTCRGQSWVTPITATDVWTLAYDLDTLTGVAALKEAIATASPPAPGSAARSARSARSAGPVLPQVPAANVSSNGWALGRDATASHDGMVLANPHVPWTGNARLYQVQFTIPGVLNVSGASLYGTPMLEFGHTSGVAWTQTASHAARLTPYRLSLVSGDPTSYLVDGHALAMDRQQVTVTVRDPAGQLSAVTRTLYSSRYGPVLGTGWTTANAFAARDAGADNLRSVDEWLAMGRSENLTQLRAAQDTYQGLPWTYTLAADTDGTVYFADASVAPHVTTTLEQQCQVGQLPGDVPIPILNGSTAACDWGSDPDAIEPGIFGPDNYPQLTRADYVANSNNSPRLANPAAPLTGYQPIYDPRSQLELRPRLSLNMISERLTGTDGYGTPAFTLTSLQETMLGQRNYGADLARDAVVAMCRAHPVLTATDGSQVGVCAACSVLAAWNGRADVSSRGEVLWQQAYGQLNYAPSSWWRVPFDPVQPVTTPRDLNTDNPEVQHTLADAVEYFRAHGVPLDITLGAVQHYAGISLPGCTEGEGCFDRVEGGTPKGSAIGTEASNGSSFIMATELTPAGPRTRTILAYSESANPASPHYADQTVLFSRGKWVTERFTEAEINADPQLQTTTLSG